MTARETSGDAYRARYLKLKSALYDRTTGLPAFPVLLDRLRSLLEERQAVGVLVVSIENLGMVASLSEADGIGGLPAAQLQEFIKMAHFLQSIGGRRL